MYTQPPGGYGYYTYTPPPDTPQQQERKRLRSDGNYIGIMMLALIVGMQFAYVLVALLLITLGVLPAGSLYMENLGLDNTTFLCIYAVIYALAMGLPAVLVAVCCRRRHFPLTPAKPVSAGVASLSFLGAIGVCMIANIITNYLMVLFSEWGLPMPEMPQMLEHTGTSLVLNLFVLAVLPALLEEMVFRGYVLRALRPYGDVYAVLISSLLFGLMHGNIRQVPFAILVGFSLGWLYVATNNIWLPVLVHFSNNAVSVCMEYLGFSLSEIAADMFYTLVIYGLAAIGIVAFVILAVRHPEFVRPACSGSCLTAGDRVGSLLKAPAFLIAVLLFILLMTLELFVS